MFTLIVTIPGVYPIMHLFAPAIENLEHQYVHSALGIYIEVIVVPVTIGREYVRDKEIVGQNNLYQGRICNAASIGVNGYSIILIRLGRHNRVGALEARNIYKRIPTK